MVLCSAPITNEVLSFSMNAAQDTLPHNANLALWRKKDGLSDVCKLCRMRQMLSHVLNQCPVSLHLRRYNTRHDAVLEVIKISIMPLLSDADRLIADLHSHQPNRPHQSQARPSTLEHQQPYGMSSGTHHLFRETRYEETHSLKENKYADLVEKIRKASICGPKLITLEAGSRGPFHATGFINL